MRTPDLALPRVAFGRIVTLTLIVTGSLAAASCKEPVAPASQAAPPMLAPDLTASASIGSGATLAAPSNATAVAVSPTQINVSWQDNSSNESGFELDRSTTGPGGSFTLLARAAAKATSYSDTGLAASTQYCYKVRAFRTTGGKTAYSSFSSTACATTPPSSPPAAPVIDATYPLSSTAVQLLWRDNSSNEDGFRVERSLDNGATWTIAGTTITNDANFADSGLVSEQPVCYRVTAFNVKGDSPPSNTGCTTPPAGPTDLLFGNLDSATFGLTWTDNSAVEDGYEVFYCPYGCQWAADLPANSTSYAVSCSDSGSYFVVAVKDGGWSDPSPLVAAWCGGSPLASSSAMGARALPKSAVRLAPGALRRPAGPDGSRTRASPMAGPRSTRSDDRRR